MGRLRDAEERFAAMSIDLQLMYLWMTMQIILGMWLALPIPFYVLIFAPLFLILFCIDMWHRYRCGWRWDWRSLGSSNSIIGILVVVAGVALMVASFFAPSEFRRLPAMTVFVMSIALFKLLGALKIVSYTQEEFSAACEWPGDEPGIRADER